MSYLEARSLHASQQQLESCTNSCLPNIAKSQRSQIKKVIGILAIRFIHFIQGQNDIAKTLSTYLHYHYIQDKKQKLELLGQIWFSKT